MRLRNKLFLVFFLLAVVPLAGLSVYSFYSSERAYCQAVLEEVNQLAESMGSRVHRVQIELDRRLRSMGPDPFYAMLSEDPKHPKADAYSQLIQHLGTAADMIEAIEVEPPAAPQPASVAATGPWPPGPPPTHAVRPAQLFIKMPGPPTAPATTGDEAGESSAVIQVPDLGNLMVRSIEGVPGLESRDRKGDRTRSEVHLRWIEEKARRIQQDALEQIAAAQELSTRPEAVLGQMTVGSVHAFMKRTRKDGGDRAECLDLTSRLDLPNEGETRIVAQLNAKAILGSALSRVPRDKGEIAFAIDPSGNLYTLDPASYQTLESLGIDWSTYPDSGKPPEDWIVASKRDPGSSVLFGIAKPIGDGLREIRRAAAYNLAIGLGLVCLALIGIIPLSRRLTRDVTALTDGVDQLAQGRLQTRVPVGSTDELGRLSRAFNRMAGQLAENQTRLVEQERIHKELEMCRKIQKEMLPRKPLRFPFGEVSGISIPAREVGGDFFNYFSLPDGRVALLIGDVSGKGVAAALLMANVQATLRARLTVGEDLATLFSELDGEIAETTPPETYFTLFVGVLDASARKLRWVNAGHNTQYLLRSDGSLEQLASSGRPIGLLPGSRYEEVELDLEQGDSIFLYTDGLVEAEDTAGIEFGNARLETILTQERSSQSDLLLSRVEEAVRGHRGTRDNHDDATMLVFKTETWEI